MKQVDRSTLAWAIRSGELDKYSRQEQLNIFINSCDNPADVHALANRLDKVNADKNGIIKFKVSELHAAANKWSADSKKRKEERAAEANERKTSEAEACGLTSDGQRIQNKTVPIGTQSTPKFIDAEVVEKAAGRAASNSTLGFDVTKFTDSANQPNMVGPDKSSPANRNRIPGHGINIGSGQTVQPQIQSQQLAPTKNPVVQLKLPENYYSLPVDNRADVLEAAIAATPDIIPPTDMYSNLSKDMKKANLQLKCEFVPHKHKINDAQVICLHNLIMGTELRNKLGSLGADINNLHFTEVEPGVGNPFRPDNRYDFIFTVNTNKPNEVIVVKILSVPVYDNNTGIWSTSWEAKPFQYHNKQDKNHDRNKKHQKRNEDKGSMGTLGDIAVESSGQANMILQGATLRDAAAAYLNQSQQPAEDPLTSQALTGYGSNVL